jgi:hypothetical protein
VAKNATVIFYNRDQFICYAIGFKTGPRPFCSIVMAGTNIKIRDDNPDQHLSTNPVNKFLFSR